MNDSSLTERSLWLAVNSHGWEDFPVHHQGEQAAELLAGWGALWHPAVLRGARQLPKWLRIDSLPEQAKGSIVVVPEFARNLVPEDLVNRLTDLGGSYFFGNAERMEVVQKILGDDVPLDGPFDTEISDDFFALGYCYLQVQLMTRQLRYVSTLDNAVLGNKCFEAVDAAATGERSKCRDLLQACFDQLLQERNRYYPTCASLLDCIYLGRETLGPELSSTLNQPNRITIQAAGCVFEEMGKTPEKDGLKQQIQDRLDKGHLSLAVGPDKELMFPLMSLSSTVRQVIRGRVAAERTFPNGSILAYATRRFGLGRSLPGILKLAGYASVVHSTLDDGVFPQTTKNNMRWQGDDATTIDALATPPRLADAPESWLGLGITIGEQIDAQHYSSVFIVHWPGQKCDSYTDLVNSSRFGDILGRFVTLDEYFGQVSDPGYSQNYRSDDYRNPYLSQMISAGAIDPISRFVRYWHRAIELLACQGLDAMTDALANNNKPEPALDFESIGLSIDQAIESTENRDDAFEISEKNELASCRFQLATRFVESLSGNRPKVDGSDQTGQIVVNPFAFSRKCLVSGHSTVIPACGFSWVSDSQPAKPRPKSRWWGKSNSVRMVQEETSIQNEFFILDINEVTGGIRAVQLHNRRRSLVSQQLALRQAGNIVSRGGKKESKYSKMISDSINVVEDTETSAAIETTGRLAFGSRDAGTFRQKLRMERGSPVVEVDLAVDLTDSITGSPWENYLASRIAWNNESAEFHTWLHETRQPTSLNRIVAPIALEIDQQSERVCLLPGGLPFHQRVGYRKLDTLLATQGESSREWKFAIAINVSYPWMTAFGALCKPIVIPDVALEAACPVTGWLFHLNCKNVAVIGWNARKGEGKSMLVMVREAEGRKAKVAIDCARSIRQAWACDLSGNRLNELVVSNGKAEWEMVAHELAQIELVW